MRKLICALIGASALVASAATYIQTSSTGTAPWRPVKDSVSQAHLADSARHAPPSAYADSSRASGLADSAKRAGWAPLDSGRVRGIVGDTATALRGAMGAYLPLAGGRMSGKLRLSAPYGTGIDFLQYHATYGGVRLWHYGDASTYVGMKFSAIDTNGGSLTLPVWVVADVFAGYLHGSADSAAYSSTATNSLSLGGVAAANYGTLAQDTVISKRVASDTATVLRTGIASAITTSEAYATARISDSLTANARSWTTLTAAKSSIHDTATALRTYIGSASTTGNAATSTKLATARTIATSGDVTGTPTAFDGTANITIPTAFANTHLAGINQDLTTTSSPTFTTVTANLTGTASNASALGGVAADKFVQGNGSSTWGTRTTNLPGSSTALTQGLKSGFYDNDGTNSSGTPTGGWCHMLVNAHTGSSPGTQFQWELASGFWNGEIYSRTIANGAIGDWNTLIHSGNYPSFNNFTSGLTTTTLNASGLITANGGITGNLTGTASNASALGGIPAAGYGTLAQDTAIAKRVASDTATVLRAGIASAITTSEAYATARISDSLTANARAWTTLTAAKSSIHDTAAILRSNMAGYLPLTGGTLTGFLTGTSAELWTNINAHDYGPALTLHGSIYTSEANLLLRSSTGYGNFLGFSDQSKSAGLQRWNFGVENDTLQIQANSASDGIGGTLVFKLSRNGNLTIPGTLTASSLSGNSATATQLATPRTISTTGDGAWSTSFDGSANVTGKLTLATVNSNVGSFGSGYQVPYITVNAKGQVTAVANYNISISHSQINDWSTATSSFLTANQSISLKGAVTGSGTTSIATSFDNTHLAGIDQELTTTSSPTFGSASLGTWVGGNSYSWTGFTGYNSTTWSGFMQNSVETLIGALSGGSVSLAVAQTRLLTISGSLVSTTLPLTVAGLITANGGISGNLTGHASLDIPLTGSSAITGALIPNGSTYTLGNSSNRWQVFGNVVSASAGFEGNLAGNVTGNVTGSASLNLLLAGGDLSGHLGLKYTQVTGSSSYAVSHSDCGTIIFQNNTYGVNITLGTNNNVGDWIISCSNGGINISGVSAKYKGVTYTNSASLASVTANVGVLKCLWDGTYWWIG